MECKDHRTSTPCSVAHATNLVISSAIAHDFHQEGVLSKLLEDNSTGNSAVMKRSSSMASPAPKYKFVVHSSIIQGLESDGQGGERGGSRGIHSAVGAYWNNDHDGVWSTKWDGHPTKSLQVVVSIVYIALV